MKHKFDKPTKNKSYNEVLARWNSDPRERAAGRKYLPECEDCGRDLTGKDVFETRTGWFCENCAEDNFNGGPSDDWLRQQERKQMGIE